LILVFILSDAIIDVVRIPVIAVGGNEGIEKQIIGTNNATTQ
jgi:hypothetical protein